MVARAGWVWLFIPGNDAENLSEGRVGVASVCKIGAMF